MDDVTMEKYLHLRQMSNTELRELLRNNTYAEQENEELTQAILRILDAKPCGEIDIAALREDFDAHYRDLTQPLYPVELSLDGDAHARGKHAAASRRYFTLSVRILGRAALIAALVCTLIVAACAASMDVRTQIVNLIVTHVSAAGTPPTPEEIAAGVSNFSGFIQFIWANLF